MCRSIKGKQQTQKTSRTLFRYLRKVLIERKIEKQTDQKHKQQQRLDVIHVELFRLKTHRGMFRVKFVTVGEFSESFQTLTYK
jgi:hypothetical protein